MTPNKRATLKTAALLLIFLVILGTGMAMIVYSMTQPPLPGARTISRLTHLPSRHAPTGGKPPCNPDPGLPRASQMSHLPTRYRHSIGDQVSTNLYWRPVPS